MGALRVTSLGSGSKGNATLLEYGDTLLLVDCGFSSKELVSRLAERGISAEQLSAVLVTHEHSDHFNGVPTFSNRHRVPVWMSHGTSLFERSAKINDLRIFNSHESFKVENIEIKPVLVPHDAREACQFVFIADKFKVGILTDLGHITPFVSSQYQQCDMLLLEFNHDRELLFSGSYPASLKARVAGSLGHLSNAQALEFLQLSDTSKLQLLAAMHLSEQNNQKSLVADCLLQAGLHADTQTILAEQDSGFDWIEINSY